MSDEMNIELEIIIDLQEDKSYIARCPYFPQAVGIGKSERTALVELGNSIIKATNSQMKFLVKQLASKLNDFRKDQDQENSKSSKMLFSLKLPGAKEAEKMSPAGEKVLQDLMTSHPMHRNLQDFIPMSQYNSSPYAQSPAQNGPMFDSVVIMGLPFSNN
jgi:hypothetical protein